MSCTRTYRITVEDLKRLQGFADFFADQLLGQCPHCGTDLCDNCQASADLRQKLIDAVSLAEAGMEIVFTTCRGETESIPKEKLQ